MYYALKNFSTYLTHLICLALLLWLTLMKKNVLLSGALKFAQLEPLNWVKLPTRKGKISIQHRMLPDDKFWGESVGI